MTVAPRGYDADPADDSVEAAIMTSDDDDLRLLAYRRITADSLPDIRADTTFVARSAGLEADRADKFALAVHEVAANTIDHASETGELTVIQDDETALVAEVADHGPGINEPLPIVGPPADALRGRGLWLSQAMTDRIRVDSGSDGTIVRLEMLLGDDTLEAQTPPREDG